MRFLLSLIIALSFVLAPGAASAAPSVACSMPGAETGTAWDHEEMGCCTPDCAAAAAAAVLPQADAEPQMPVAERHAGLRVASNAPPSFNPAAIDPPPRHRFV